MARAAPGEKKKKEENVTRGGLKRGEVPEAEKSSHRYRNRRRWKLANLRIRRQEPEGECDGKGSYEKCARRMWEGTKKGGGKSGRI